MRETTISPFSMSKPVLNEVSLEQVSRFSKTEGKCPEAFECWLWESSLRKISIAMQVKNDRANKLLIIKWLSSRNSWIKMRYGDWEIYENRLKRGVSFEVWIMG